MRAKLLLVTVPLAAATRCSETCGSASDGICDDGASGAVEPGSACHLGCAFGTDCADCGARPDQFTCTGPTTKGELAASLYGPTSGYD
eukprot:1096936-Prymnesium_polylepis.1